MSAFEDLRTKADVTFKKDESSISAWIKAHWMKIVVSHVSGWAAALALKHFL